MSRFRIISAKMWQWWWLMACLIPLIGQAAPTDLDKDFGNDGKLLTTIGTATVFNAVTVQSDHKLVVVGQSTQNNGQTMITVVRYQPNGQFDTSFGSSKNGIVTEPVRANTNTMAMDVALQMDGKIVVAAMAQDFTEFMVIRLLPDGHLDTTFAGTGKVTTPMSPSGKIARVHALEIQRDGKIVVVGSSEVGSTAGDSNIALVRYQTDGSLDTTFGADGKVITVLGSGQDEANALEIQTDGKIIVAGSSFNGKVNEAAVVRYQPNGTLDNTFGINGIATFPIDNGGTALYDLELQEDGKILVAGSTHNGTYQNFALARLQSNGLLDSSFGNNGAGKVVISFGQAYSVAYSLEIQASGNILLGGYAEKSANQPLFAVARLFGNGTFDASFGSEGKILTEIAPPNVEKANQLELQDDGKILAVGSSTSSSGNAQGAMIRYRGDPPTRPEIEVAQDDISISNADTFDFGITSLGVNSTKTFTVTNQGTAPLTLIEPIQITSTTVPSVFSSSAHFTLLNDVGNSSTVNANSLVLAANASATFTVTLDGATVGTYQAVVAFNNDDSDEARYQFTVKGQVTTDKISKLELWNNDLSLDSGKTEIDYGATLQGQPTSRMFTVKNTGNSDLMLSNLTVPNGFVLNSSFPNVISSGSSVAFDLQFNPATAGSYSGTVQFNTNDLEKNPFSFTVKGFTGTGAQTTPIGTQLEVLESGLYLQDGVGMVNFGTVWNAAGREILLYNTGTTQLQLNNLALPNGFVLRNEFPKIIEANGKIPLHIEFNATEEATYSGAMTFNSSDPKRGTVNIYLSATRSEKPSENSNAPPPPSGMIEDNRSNMGNTMTDVTITSSGSVTGGYLSGDIKNQGLIANVHINPDSKIDGGKVSGYNTNQGAMCNIEVSNDSKVDGGVYCGTVLNQGTLTDPKIEKDAMVKGDGMLSGTVHNEGTVCGMRLDAGAQIVGGQLGCDIKGDETKPAIIGGQAQIQANTSLENVCITRSVVVSGDVSLGSHVTINNSSSSNAVMQDYCIQPQEVPKFDDKRVQGTEKAAFETFDPANVAVLPETAVASLSAEQMSAFKKEALQGLQVNQFKQMSPTTLSGLTKENIGGFRAAVMQEMTVNTLNALPPEALQQTEDFAKLATNVDLDKIKPQHLTGVIPENWQLDSATGRLQPPPGSKISFKAMEKQEINNQVEMPMDMPDLSTSLAVGGRAIAGETVVEKLNQTLFAKGFGEFSLSQHTSGIVMVEGSSTSKDVSLALMPESDNMQQVDVTTQTSGISVDDTGRYQVTTEDGWQIPMVPAPQDVNDLATVLGTDSTVKVGKKGDVLMGYSKNQRRGGRDGEVYIYIVVIFDPFIDPTLQDFCTSSGCDWNTIPGSLQPGVNYDAGNGRAKQQINVIYSQGKAQKAYPTVLSPEDFMTEAKKFAGVESIVYNTDGSFTFVYQGQTLHLYPSTDVTAKTLEQYETVKPSLTLQKNGTLAYSVQSGDLLLTSSVVISE